MKRIIQFFAVCLALSVFQTGFVYGAENIRGTQKRDANKIVSVGSNSRSYSGGQKTDTNKYETSRTTTKNVKPAKQTSNEKKSVVSRSNATKQNIKQRSTVQNNVVSRTNTHSEKNVRSGKNVQTQTKTVSARSPVYSRASKRTVSRAAEIDTEKLANIKSKDYSKCKTVYYECMDEFCANKDANLRRCSCSARVHEFDAIKKQLDSAEDKMLDFNQRLLTVNLDKEDALAINKASEGELAFEKQDTSESEKLLKKITDALNTSGDSKINNNLSAISLSLNTDSAWDTVDSLSGISTTSKNGLDLYDAATPVCIEMAHEVCSDEELEIAQNGYKLTIQQDCNTVAKSYNSQYNNAMNKIHESSALLDMARLNNYQQRNSDDTLTCKKKTLEQLSDESVCGKNLYKCLDTTGQYINPSTGEAFLSEDLYNLSYLLTVPSGDETWSKTGQNDKFVTFLNSKKQFLEPATKQCQDIADTIWQEFIDDALAQIKLAQNSKLEEIRRSCTTLVTECKSSAKDSLSEFDSRALSTFSIIADTTVNALCSDVEKSCIALLNASGVSDKWEAGITEIALNMTYDKIIDSCTTVGQNCIIQHCNGASGNFALCEDYTSPQRRAILKYDACWDEVHKCVQQAQNLESMSYGILNRNNSRDSFYANLYDLQSGGSVFKKCENDNNLSADCLLTEQIWGNCEDKPTKDLTATDHNKILIPKNGSTLMSWFANNTGSKDYKFSCNAAPCPVNYTLDNNNKCSLNTNITTTDGKTAKTEAEALYVGNTGSTGNNGEYIINNDKYIINHCENGITDSWGNCCTSEEIYLDKATGKKICVPSKYQKNPTKYKVIPVETVKCNSNNNDDSNNNDYYCHLGENTTMTVYCVSEHPTPITFTPDTDDQMFCNNGFWIIIDEYGNYFDPVQVQDNNESQPQSPSVSMQYKPAKNTECTYGYHNSSWQWWGGNDKCSAITNSPKTDFRFLITYPNRQ